MKLSDLLSQPNFDPTIVARLERDILHLHFPNETLFENIIHAFSWELGSLAESLDCRSLTAHCPGYRLEYMYPSVLKQLAVKRLRDRGVLP